MLLLELVLRCVIAILGYYIWIELHALVVDEILCCFEGIDVAYYAFRFCVEMTYEIDLLAFFDGFHDFDLTFGDQVSKIPHEGEEFSEDDHGNDDAEVVGRGGRCELVVQTNWQDQERIAAQPHDKISPQFSKRLEFSYGVSNQTFGQERTCHHDIELYAPFSSITQQQKEEGHDQRQQIVVKYVLDGGLHYRLVKFVLLYP